MFCNAFNYTTNPPPSSPFSATLFLGSIVQPLMTVSLSEDSGIRAEMVAIQLKPNLGRYYILCEVVKRSRLV